jgi:uncharacterized protein RhaS with RHS repeats
MRDYDPTTGRYLEADPLGLVDGASVYGYAGQSPMMYTDPTGEVVPLLLGLAVLLAALLTPDAANAPGECDLLIEPTPFAPYVNGINAGLSVTGIGAGYQALKSAAAAVTARSAAASALAKATPIGSALKDDVFHRAATFARDFAVRNGKHFPLVGGDGVTRTLTQVLGRVNDVAGRFEYIVDAAGNLTHQLFIAGGRITGKAIVP